MSKKKDTVLSQRDVAARAAYIHRRNRDEIEFREENPRDIVALMPDAHGELIARRVPLRALALDQAGHEVLDPVPVAPPVSQRPLSTFEQIREFNRRQQLMDDWPDATLADEDNFDIPDDPPDPASNWEETFEVASVDEIFKRARNIVIARKKAAQEKASAPPSDGPRTPVNETPSNTAPPQKTAS